MPLVSTVSLEHELVFIERKYDMPRLSFAVPGGNYGCDSFVCTLLIVIFGQETGNYAHFCLITTYSSRYELFLRKASVLTRHNCTTGESQNLGDIFIPLFHGRRCIHSRLYLPPKLVFASSFEHSPSVCISAFANFWLLRLLSRGRDEGHCERGAWDGARASRSLLLAACLPGCWKGGAPLCRPPR